MSALWAHFRWFSLSLLLLFPAFSGAQPVSAVEPSFDYWFVETITLGEVDLPKGIAMYAVNPDSEPRANLVLENRTETPLYVLSLSYQDVLVMETPDPNWKDRIRLAHEVASYLVSPTRPVYLDVESLVDLDPNLVDQNVLRYAPPPADLAVLAPQSSYLLLVYTEQVLIAPFLISYEINANYDNASRSYQFLAESTQATESAKATATQQAEIVAAQSARNITLFIGVGAAAVLFLIIWILWRGSSHPK